MAAPHRHQEATWYLKAQIPPDGRVLSTLGDQEVGTNVTLHGRKEDGTEFGAKGSVRTKNLDRTVTVLFEQGTYEVSQLEQRLDHLTPCLAPPLKRK